MTDESRLLEAFRGAAMGMRSWTSALDLVAKATRARIGQIAMLSHDGAMTLNLLSGTSPDEEAAYWIAGGPDPARNPRTRGLLAARSMVSMTDDDYITAWERERTPIYRGLFAQSDVPTSLQIKAETADRETVGLCLQRPGCSGEADGHERRLLEAVMPGVMSAVTAGLAMGSAADQVTLTTAENLAGPAMMLGDELALVSLSTSAEAMLRAGDVLTLRRGRVRAVEPAGQAMLERAFAAVAHAPVPLRRTMRVILEATGGTAVAVDLCPLPVRIAGPLSRAQALLVVRQPRVVEDRDATEDLRAAFDLTLAEASVALLLADGLSLPEVAARRGTAIGTVRTQLKLVFEKTGCRRQAELVAAIGPFRRR